MRILVTGGCGFIGSALVRHLIRRTEAAVVNLDALTYAAMPEALEDCAASPRYSFEHADICDEGALRSIFARHRPDAVVHLAAESHVDRSIDGPAAFVDTNLVGTFRLLEAARHHWQGLTDDERQAFRFLHISTDEVYGSLAPDEPAFTETTVYRPNSPYSASKAGADHLVRAWGETYGLPVLTTNCSNNYGPWQFPEKLIPVTILAALEARPIPVYGAGDNIRDWLHVEDHAAALCTVLDRGRPGARYNLGGRAERRNVDLVRSICRILDRLRPGRAPHERLIRFVEDRPGHDRRYAIDGTLIERELGWRPGTDLDDGLARTVAWYLDHADWWREVRARRYDGARLGRVV